jgi:pimeloyl-ACP methyl ester carboxylesterase
MPLPLANRDRIAVRARSLAAMAEVTEGRFSTGVPYLRLGQGPPLLVAAGLTSEHTNPKGMWRRRSLSWAAPFAEHFTVYLVNRRPGLAPGTTMADIAADYAGAIERDIGEPVLLHGTSTGGSVALQLAVDRPELVERMVVAAAACRLSPHGRAVMAEVARLTEEGDARRVSALMLGEQVPGPLTYVARGLGWAAGGVFAVDDPSDMLTTIAAEDSFDAEPGLSQVQAPTIVLGGTADTFYSEDLFRRTASGIAQGRAVIFPGRSHVRVAGSKQAAGNALGFLIGG